MTPIMRPISATIVAPIIQPNRLSDASNTYAKASPRSIQKRIQPPQVRVTSDFKIALKENESAPHKTNTYPIHSIFYGFVVALPPVKKCVFLLEQGICPQGRFWQARTKLHDEQKSAQAPSSKRAVSSMVFIGRTCQLVNSLTWFFYI